MKRVLIGVAVVLIAGVGIGRVMYGRWVGSPAFKTLAEGVINQLAAAYAPDASATIGRTSAAGLAGIELVNVSIKVQDQVLTLPSVHLKPGYVAALFSKSLPFSIDATLSPSGAFSSVGKATRKQYGGLDVDALQLQANLLNINAVPLINAKFGTGKGSRAQLVGGTVSGQLKMQSSRGTRLAGAFDGQLQNMAWRLGQAGGRVVKAEAVDLKLTFNDSTVTLMAPFVAATPLGKLSLTGAMKFTNGQSRWDLTVDPQNNPLLRMAAANLFRCQSVPGSGTFNVTGLTATPVCQ